MVMSKAKAAGAALISLIFIGFSSNALACSAAAWFGGGISGNGSVGSPSPDGIVRYSEFCAYSLAQPGGAGYVQSNLADDARYIARFYVLDGLTGAGDVIIFRGYGEDGATTTKFTVSFDGTNFKFDAGNGTQSAAGKSGWNVVEIDWAANGAMNYWVNADASADAPTGSVSTGDGVISAVRLGAPEGFNGNTGKLTFDAFESHRSTPVGLLLAGDSNGNGAINIFDSIGIQNEILDPANKLAAGQPDCNGTGSVNVFDMICVQNIILGGN